MKKTKIIMVGIVLFVLGLIYIYYYRPLVDDELFGYGFGINILRGIVPYLDFNMIVTPLFSYITAFFLWIFGKKLIVYHIMLVIIIMVITYLAYREIGYKAIIIYLLSFIYPYTGYNLFVLLLLFLLINLDVDNKHYIYKEVLIISLMILSKQTLGLLVIPSLILSKDRKKTFLTYLGIGGLFILYLVINKNLSQFIDYCFLGMFDFTYSNNKGLNLLLLFEICLIAFLVYKVIKTKDRNIFYILMFQIVAFPIVNYPHFIISFIPVVYLLLKRDLGILSIPILMFVVCYFISFSVTLMIKDDTYLYFSNYKNNSFFRYRMINNSYDDVISGINENIDKYKDYDYYLLGNFAYLVKLSNNDDINKYDLINNGNMGYKGSSRYIDEMDDNCQDKKCLFIIETRIDGFVYENQTNDEIINYVKDNYLQMLGTNNFQVYVNKI